MRPLIFTPAARYEVVEAHDWYEQRLSGLGDRFVRETDAVVERIRKNPLQFPLVHKNVRRALLKHFPYALMFVLHEDESLTVIACFHGSRNPVRWRKRL